ncbi:MAG: hypothetical protein ABIT08_10755 [Bacteroidia bacterium]
MILRTSLVVLILVIALIGVFRGNYIAHASEIKKDVKVINKLPNLSNWSPSSQALAKELMEKYGMPGEFTSNMLIWTNNGVWKKTILYREGVNHNFPASHNDVLEQTINYRVPVDKFNALSAFDGSITANRTNGTLTVRCKNESLNILALNFADDIIKDKKTTGEARLEYYKSATEIMKGHGSEFGQQILFKSHLNTSDPR